MQGSVMSFDVGDDQVRRVRVGGDALVLIAGPCVIEGEEAALGVAEAVAAMARARGLGFVFKSSFDKANRTSLQGFRGPGLEEGLRALARVREAVGVPVTTDIHEPWQAPLAAEVADLVQVPAFLCRQTDLLIAAGRCGRPVNLKKGQFLAPWDMGPAIAKITEQQASPAVVVTERGVSFGYNNLVVDLRALPLLRGLGAPVCLDATHAVQLPGGQGDRSGGQRQFVPTLARAGAAAGIDALFLEVHPDPDRAPSDGPNMVPLDALPALLDQVVAIDRIVRGATLTP